MNDNLDRSKTVELFESIKFDGREYSSLTFRPGKVGGRRLAESHLRSGQHQQALTMFAIQMLGKSAGVPDAVIEQMYDDQFAEVWNWFSGFLLGSRPSA